MLLDYQGLVVQARILSFPLAFMEWPAAARALAYDGSAEAAEVLATTFAQSPYPFQRPILREALQALRSKAAIDQAWTTWLTFRHDGLAAALSLQPPQLPCPIGLYVLSHLKLGRLAELSQVKSDVLDELLKATDDGDGDIRTRSAELLGRLANHPLAAARLAEAIQPHVRPRTQETAARVLSRAELSPESIDEICRVWARTRTPRLQSLLREHRWLASEQLPDLALLTRLKFQPDSATPDPARAKSTLRAAGDADILVARKAAALLTMTDTPRWQTAVCDAILDGDCPPALRGPLGHQCRPPEDPERRAIFFLMTDQWDKAIDLDFDQTILSAAYRTGAPALRRGIAAAIRRSRRADLIRILVRRQGDNYEHLLLPDPEWETLLSSMDSPDRADELWSLLLDAPPAWSVAAFNRLVALRWQPPEGDQIVWNKLLALQASVRQSLDWSAIEAGREPERSLLDGFPNVRVAVAAVARQVAIAATSVRCWDMNGTATLETPDGSAVRRLAWSHDGNVLAVARDTTVEVWDVAKQQVRDTLQPEPFSVMALSGDAARLVTQDPMAYRQYWDLQRGTCVRMDSAKRFDFVTLSQDGRLMVLAQSSEWRMYDVDLERAVDVFRLLSCHTQQSGLSSVQFSPDDRLLAVVTRDGLDTYAVDTGKKLSRTECTVSRIAISPDSRLLAIETSDPMRATHRDPRVRRGLVLVDPYTGARRFEFELPVGLRRDGVLEGATALRGMAFSEDGQYLRAVTHPGTVLRWHLFNTPMASLPVKVRAEAESRAAANGLPQWKWLAAVLGYRSRYDIEIDDEVVFTPGDADIEIEVNG